MATNKKKKKLSSWAIHFQRFTPSGLVAIAAPVNGVAGAPEEATYVYAVDAGHRRGSSRLVILPPLTVKKGDTVFLIPGRSESGNELGYVLYRSAPNGDKATLRAIGHVQAVKAEYQHSMAVTTHSCVGYYRDDFAPLESRVYRLPATLVARR